MVWIMKHGEYRQSANSGERGKYRSIRWAMVRKQYRHISHIYDYFDRGEINGRNSRETQSYCRDGLRIQEEVKYNTNILICIL